MKVSVVVPSVDRPRMLYRCLKSIYKESYSNMDIEVVIPDASSTVKPQPGYFQYANEYQGTYSGRTRKVVESFIGKFGHIRHINVLEDRPNPSVLKNAGMEKSQGEYICFLDDDDYLTENGIKVRAEHLDEHDCYAVFGNTLATDEVGRSIVSNREDIGSAGVCFDSLIIQNYIGNGSIMFRNTGEFYFNERIRIGEDWLNWLNIMAKKKVCYIDNNVYHWVRGHNSLTAEASRYMDTDKNSSKIREMALNNKYGDMSGKEYVERVWKKENVEKLEKGWSKENKYITIEFVDRIKKSTKSVESVLDVGSGIGRLYPYFKDKKYIGIDKASEMIKKAREKHGDHFEYGDVENIQYESKSFDLVISRDLLQHVVGFDRAVSEIKRVSKRYIAIRLLSSPKFTSQIGGWGELIVYRPEEDIIGAFNGFEVLDKFYQGENLVLIMERIRQ